MNSYKRICLCGSMSVFAKMKEIASVLEARGIEVELPTPDEPIDYSVMAEEERAPHKNEMIRRHLERIKQSDAILVVNENLKNVEGYIGANTFLEMGFAFAFGKPILLLNSIPDQLNRDELMGLAPIELKGDVSLIGESV